MGQSNLVYQNILLSEAHLPTPLTHSNTLGGEQGLAVGKRATTTTVPAGVARKLFDAYVDKVLPQYPVFLLDDVNNIYDTVYGPSSPCQQQCSSNSFITLHILAITTIISKSSDTERSLTLARSLYNDSLKYADSLNTNSVATLQSLCLLIQLTFFLPTCGDLVYLVGEAMRLAVELGLHEEVTSKMNETMTNFRRVLFWVVG